MQRDHGAAEGAHVGVGPGGSVVASGGLSWTRVRTPRMLSQVAKAAFAIGGVGSVMSSFEHPLFALAAMLGSLTAVGLFIMSYILSLTQTSFPGSLEIHPDRLEIRSNARCEVFPNDKVRSAMIVERRVFDASIPTVEIELMNGDILVARFPDPSSARVVVDALGFGASGARVHATLAKPTRRLLHPLLGLVSYIVAVWSMSIFEELFRAAGSSEDVLKAALMIYPALALALYTIAKWVVQAPEITAGDDGVRIKGRFRDRFIPRRDIAFVGAAAGTALFVETRTNERIRVGSVLLDEARRNAIARVIDDRAGPSAAGEDRFAHYGRGGRALPEWRAHLAHAMSEATYRMNPATVEEAATVLRSAQATPEQRIGAALALRIANQPRERIRVAVDAAVDDRMRDALEAVAESEDDGVIEKALQRLT